MQEHRTEEGGDVEEEEEEEGKEKGEGWSGDNIHAAVVAEDISCLDQSSNDITHLSLSIH